MGRGAPAAVAAVVAAAALLLAAAGCAGPGAATPIGAVPASPAPIARPGAAPDAPSSAATKRDLLALLEREWQALGAQRIDFTGERPSAPQLGVLEDDGMAAEQRVAGYWGVVRDVPPARACAEPWSAAFVSWAMQHGGATDFPVSGAHHAYVCELTRPADPASARFVPHRPEARAPQPGDLVCAARAGATLGLDDVCGGGPAHCDIVVEVDAAGGVLHAIGGNVFNSVSRSSFAIDASGRLAATPHRRFFAVIENRMPD